MFVDIIATLECIYAYTKFALLPSPTAALFRHWAPPAIKLTLTIGPCYGLQLLERFGVDKLHFLRTPMWTTTFGGQSGYPQANAPPRGVAPHAVACRLVPPPGTGPVRW
jgi:hypothetical protein